MMDRLRISSSHSRVSSPSLTIYPIHRNFTSNRTSFIIERRFASIVHRDDTRRVLDPATRARDTRRWIEFAARCQPDMRAIAADWKQTGIGEHRWMMRRVYQGSCCICKPPCFLPFLFSFPLPALSPPPSSSPKFEQGSKATILDRVFVFRNHVRFVGSVGKKMLLSSNTRRSTIVSIASIDRRAIKSNGSFGRRRTESRLRELWSVIRCPIMSLKLNKILASAPSSVSGLARPNIKTKDHFHASVTRLKGRWISLRVFSAELSSVFLDRPPNRPSSGRPCRF